jgi:hypothetical protein
MGEGLMPFIRRFVALGFGLFVLAGSVAPPAQAQAASCGFSFAPYPDGYTLEVGVETSYLVTVPADNPQYTEVRPTVTWGDGASEAQVVAAGQSYDFLHSFGAAGTFQPSISLQGYNGPAPACEQSASLGTITVQAGSPPPPPPPPPPGGPLAVDFTYAPTQPRSGDTVTFTGSCSQGGQACAAGAQYSWDVNGVVQTGQVVGVYFSGPGVVNATLTVTHDGTSQTATRTFNVAPVQPAPSPGPGPQPPAPPASTPPVATAPPPTGPPAEPGGPTIVTGRDGTRTVWHPSAAGWGKPLVAELNPRDKVLAFSPVLAPGRRNAVVEVIDGDHQTAVVVPDERSRSYARTQCTLFGIAAASLKDGRRYTDEIDRFRDQRGADEPFNVLTFRACLEVADELIAGDVAARQTQAGARSAAATCDRVRIGVTTTRRRTGRYLARAVRLRPSSAALVVTCRRTPRGVAVRVRTRSRRAGLRGVVGARLIVGLLRPPRAARNQPVSIVFRP